MGVGGRKRKKKKKEKEKGVGRAPADLHPPLNKKRWLRGSKKVVEVRTRASEAKGPFPGGKRVGSWGKKKNVKVIVKAHGLRSMGLLFLHDVR